MKEKMGQAFTRPKEWVVALAFLASVGSILYLSITKPELGQLPSGLTFLSGILIRDYLAIRQDRRNDTTPK